MRAIQILLWTSLGVSLIIFALSMVFLGAFSIFIAPCSVAVTLAYLVTLLALSTRDRRRSRAARINNVPLVPLKGSALLPSVCRMPSIVFGILLAVLWVVSFSLTAWITSVFSNGGDWGINTHLLPVTYVDIVFQGIQVGVVTLSALCLKERAVLEGKGILGQLVDGAGKA
jgi:hypothetical protein